MAIYGRYETVRELTVVGRVSAYLAKPAGSRADGDARFIIKVFRAPAASPQEQAGAAAQSPSAHAVAVEMFLDRLRTQEKLADRDPAHWQTIRDIGAVGGGTGQFYCVCDFAENTAADLIAQKAELSSEQLYRIASGVVGGLKHIRDAAGRRHGNLRPSNVLIGGELDGGSETQPSAAPTSGNGSPASSVRLSDPAPAKTLGGDPLDFGDDLRALGELIYELVTHQRVALAAQAASSLPDSPAWKRLGRRAKVWRELCGKLLSEGPKRPAALDDVERHLARLAPRKRSALPWVAAAAGVALAAALLIGLPILTRDPPRVFEYSEAELIWHRFCIEHEVWFARVWSQIEKADRSESAPAKLLAQRLATQVQKVRSEKIVFDPLKIANTQANIIDIANGTGVKVESPDKPGELAYDNRKVELAQRALDEIDRFKDAISQLDEVKVLAELQQQCKAQGWTQLEGRLADFHGRVMPPTPAEVEERLNDVPLHGGVIKKHLDPVDLANPLLSLIENGRRLHDIRESLGRLARAIPTIEKGDEVAKSFIVSLKTEVEGYTGEVLQLDKLVSEHATLGDSLAAAVKNHWLVNVDQDWFKARSESYELLRPQSGEGLADLTVSKHAIVRWIEEVKLEKFAKLQPETDPRRNPKAWDPLGELDRLKAEINDPAAADLEELGKLRPVADQIDLAEITRILGLSWEHLYKEDIESGKQRIDAQLRSLNSAVVVAKGCVPGEENEDYKARIRQEDHIAASKSVSIDQVWKSRRDLALEQKVEKHCSILEPERKLLLKLDETIPFEIVIQNKPQEVQAALLREAAVQHREQLVGQALSQIDWSRPGGAGGGMDAYADRWKQLGAEYSNWLASAERIVESFAKIEVRLNRSYGLAESSEGASPGELWAAAKAESAFEALQPALTPVLNRLQMLEQIEARKQVDAELIALATGRGPAARVAAWRKLGVLNWPSTVAQLQEEARIRRDINAWLSPLQDDAKSRRDELTTELVRRGHESWSRVAARLVTMADIHKAISLKNEFAVRDDDLDQSIRFNLLLYHFAESMQIAADQPQSDTDQIIAAFEAFEAQVRSIRPLDSSLSIAPVYDHPLIRELLDHFQQMVDSLKNKPKFNPAEHGPGKEGWAYVRTDDETTLRYIWQSSQVAHDLTFILVRPDEGPPAYVCSTEMSLGLLIAWFEYKDGWKSLRDFLSQSSSSWEGPRVWKAERGKLVRNDFWLANINDWQGHPHYKPAWGPGEAAPDLIRRLSLKEKGGNPALDHPMQNISVPAAIAVCQQFGCRLPNSNEWQAAYAIELGDQSEDVFIKTNPRLNLRDRTWREHDEYVKGLAEKGAAEKSALQYLQKQWPGAGSYLPVDNGALDLEDGVLWFAPVRQPAPAGGPERFQHLLGNVAELVSDKANLLAENAVSVAGGSSISAPPIGAGQPISSYGKPLPLKRPQVLAPGFADVGFRLAFTAENVSKPVHLARDMHQHLISKIWFLSGSQADGQAQDSPGAS